MGEHIYYVAQRLNYERKGYQIRKEEANGFVTFRSGKHALKHTLFFVKRISKVQSFCMLILKSKFLNVLGVPGSGRLVISCGW